MLQKCIFSEYVFTLLIILLDLKKNTHNAVLDILFNMLFYWNKNLRKRYYVYKNNCLIKIIL